MCVSKRDSKISMLGFVLGALYLGLAGSAMAWITAPTDYPDVKIVGGEVSAGKAAFDPSNPNYLVTGGKCFVKSSKDGGKTWSAGVTLPQLPGATCNSNSAPPAVAYAADGSRLYAAYGYTRVAPDNWTQYGVEFSVSTDHGASWSTPLSIVENPESFIYSVIELAAAPDGPWVYMVIQ